MSSLYFLRMSLNRLLILDNRIQTRDVEKSEVPKIKNEPNLDVSVVGDTLSEKCSMGEKRL